MVSSNVRYANGTVFKYFYSDEARGWFFVTVNDFLANKPITPSFQLNVNTGEIKTVHYGDNIIVTNSSFYLSSWDYEGNPIDRIGVSFASDFDHSTLNRDLLYYWGYSYGNRVLVVDLKDASRPYFSTLRFSRTDTYEETQLGQLESLYYRWDRGLITTYLSLPLVLILLWFKKKPFVE